MLTLNLFDPHKTDIAFEATLFPDGQPHIEITDTNAAQTYRECRILTRLCSMDEVALALFANNALQYLGFEKIHLHISYLLTARMDRVMTNGEPFSLKVLGELLNTANFHKVCILDPHSPVSNAVINRSVPVFNQLFVADALNDYLQLNPHIGKQNILLVSPDAGALKKIIDVSKHLGNLPIVECSKLRDVETGRITHIAVNAKDLSGKHCFLVDDILDGGGTFSGIAKELHQLNAANIFVAVTHGIFSKGFQLPFVDKIYTTNSYKDWKALPSHIKVFDAAQYLGG